MHVLFFNRSYFPDQTATGRLLTALAEGLVRDHGFRVTVITGPPLASSIGGPGAPSSWPHCERRNGVTILRTAGSRFDKARFAGRATNYVTYFLTATLRGLRGRRPDVVVALTDPPIIGIAAWLAARRHGAPFVMAFQDLFPEVAALLPDFHSPTINGALELVNRWLVRRAAVNVALGETMRDRLVEGKRAPADRTVVIPHSADTSAVKPGPKDNPFARRHGLHDRFVVMHSGNLGLAQNLETLVEAAALVAGGPTADDVVFVLQGDGVLRHQLEAQVNVLGLGNVRFLPFAAESELGESFASADVFVVALQAGLAGYIVPSKLYGILAAGRPYIAAVDDGSEVAALTRTHGCGEVIAPGRAADLAEAILRLKGTPEVRSRMGEASRRLSASFDRRLHIARYATLIRDVRRNRPRTSRLKRGFDVLLSATGLLCSLPVSLPAAVAIKLADGGPIFYSQERAGLRGRPFLAYKFRSMIPDAEAAVGARQATEHDARVTNVGRWLRRTAMDELPQLWNILRGDMSFVGPRALRPGEIESTGHGTFEALEDVPGYAERSRVVPGLTGLAQIYARRDLPRRQKFRYDRLYADRQSFGLDLRLILLSFWISARGRWEVRGRKF